ncbi:MAG: precorrin-2 C(20)-methyltransferase [Myxococcota bacterium]
MTTGTIYGVGVGPGDPDLVTVRAARILERARYVAFFRKAGSKGRARSIADAYLGDQVESLPLEYPVTTELPHTDARYKALMLEFYDESTNEVWKLARQGHEVAVICEGDPFFYGSFMHLYDRLPEEAQVEVVPGITSMSAAWTLTGVPVTRGTEVMTVLTGIDSEEELVRRMRDTDALVVMKLGRQLPKVRRALHAAGLAQRAWLVEYATMPQQRVHRLAELPQSHVAPYFSVVVVHGTAGQP